MKVVFGTDGSDHAKFGEEFLKLYPLGEGAEILCCGVSSPVKVVTATSHPFLGPLIADHISDAVEAERNIAARAAEEAAAVLSEAGFAASPRVLEGDPPSELANLAEAENADLVAIGSRGKSAIEALFLGSVARTLANDSRLTLLICRKKPFGLPAGLRAMFATDHSDFANDVARKLPSLVGGKFKSLDVVSVMDPISRDLMEALPEGRTGESWAQLEERLEQWLNEETRKIAAELSGLGEMVTGSVVYGETREKLAERIEEAGIDLVIVGARGRSAVSRMLLGSVSHQMVTRATCSVMVVRT